MAQINLTNAKKLCTAAEFRVVQASNPSQVNQFSADALKKHTVEARRLRDKWRDLAHRQLRQVRQSKGVRSADDSNRTAKKAELFAKVLARFESLRVDRDLLEGHGRIGGGEQRRILEQHL